MTPPPGVEPNFLYYLAGPVSWLILIYIWVVIIRIVLSWFSPNLYQPSRFVVVLSKLTDRPLGLARRWFPWSAGRLDLSPVVFLALLNVLQLFCYFGLSGLGLSGNPLILPMALIKALALLIISLAWLFIIVMAVRIIMPLIKASPYNPIVQVIYSITQPLLRPVGFLPRYYGLLDVRALGFIGLAVLAGLLLPGLLNHWADQAMTALITSRSLF